MDFLAIGIATAFLGGTFYTGRLIYDRLMHSRMNKVIAWTVLMLYAVVAGGFVISFGAALLSAIK